MIKVFLERIKENKRYDLFKYNKRYYLLDIRNYKCLKF